MKRKAENATPPGPEKRAVPPEERPTLYISGINTPVCVQLLVDKSEYIIGKGLGCDGVLNLNSEISKEHCRLLWRDGQYTVRDLGSLNGTCLNEHRLSADDEEPVFPGDALRLSSFIFEIKQIDSGEES